MGQRWMALLMLVYAAVADDDSNTVFSPCTDSTIQRFDGFTLGLTFSSKDKFFFNHTQLSPCDTRLRLSAAAQLAVFRPKVDEVSLLTLDDSFIPSASGRYMVAFAGQKYAARSPPTFVGDDTRVVTSFTLVLEFEMGILYNLYWQKLGCGGCNGKSGLECVDKQDCAVKTSKCKSNNINNNGSSGGATSSMGCNIGIQVLFSGTDKHHQLLNSWYESDNLRKYSLFGLYAGIRDVFAAHINGIF